MKVRKPGTMEHPDLGSKVVRPPDPEPEGPDYILRQAKGVEFRATQKMLAWPSTLPAVLAAYPHALRAIKPAQELNPFLRVVKFCMMNEWPHSCPLLATIGMYPREQRYNALHTVWHEMGHLAHLPHEYDEHEDLLKSPFRLAFMAWKRESRKSVNFLADIKTVRFIRYITNVKDEALSLTNRRTPSLWRKQKDASSKTRALSKHRFEVCAAYVSGWDEFLAEAFLKTHMPGQLPVARLRRYQVAFEKHFPLALKAYRKAVVDDRRIKRRERSGRVLARMAKLQEWVQSLAAETEIDFKSVEPGDRTCMQRTETLCTKADLFDDEPILA